MTLMNCIVIASVALLGVISAQDLACPQSPFFFPTPRTEPLCDKDRDCKRGEKCCFWDRSKHCLKGIDTTPKPGSCPASPPSVGPPNCLADFAGCRFDSECRGDQKCCKNERCGYGECKNAVIKDTATPCTEIGCGPAPGPYCSRVTKVRPNGPGCEPVCEVCADDIPAPAPVPTPTPTPAPSDLACPRNQFFFPTERTEPRCKRDSQCAAGEKCCLWTSGTKHCLKGIERTPKPGTCPAPRPIVGGPGPCKQDFVGCRFDAECGGKRKCCENEACFYSECTEPEDDKPQFEACTKIGCGPAPGPECKVIRSVRPNGPNCSPVCSVCADRVVTTSKPEICEIRWQLECTPKRRGSQLFSFSYGSNNQKGSRCKHVRKRVCH